MNLLMKMKKKKDIRLKTQSQLMKIVQKEMLLYTDF